MVPYICVYTYLWILTREDYVYMHIYASDLIPWDIR